MRYIVHVTLLLDDGTFREHEFDYWCDACSWIENLANNDSIPSQVIMRMEIV